MNKFEEVLYAAKFEPAGPITNQIQCWIAKKPNGDIVEDLNIDYGSLLWCADTPDGEILCAGIGYQDLVRYLSTIDYL
jgi:hypothetical protein